MRAPRQFVVSRGGKRGIPKMYLKAWDTGSVGEWTADLKEALHFLWNEKRDAEGIAMRLRMGTVEQRAAGARLEYLK